MTMPRLRLFGDSHIKVLKKAYDLARESGQGPTLDIAFYRRRGPNWLAVEIEKVGGALRVKAKARVGDLDVDYRIDDPGALYIFSSPLHSAPSYHQPDWQRFCPWEVAALFPDLQPLSAQVMERWLAEEMQKRWELLRAMKERGFSMAVLEPPKPLIRAPALGGIAPEILRAVDRQHRRFVAEHLADEAIPIIAAPDETHADGFTLDAFAAEEADDPHHGNIAYGEKALASVLAFAKR